MSTVSDMKADMVILGSMQLSKFKPGGLVIGSLASAVAKAAPAHVTVVKNYMVA